MRIEVDPGKRDPRRCTDVRGRADDAAGGELGATAVVLGSQDTA
jgi:hypothetical protein